MKTSFIVTVFNEEENVEKLLESLLAQTKMPDEVVVVDGGSFDETVRKIEMCKHKFVKRDVKFRVITKRGNRSEGRNEAIKNSTGDIILCSDAGCVLSKNWVESISQPFEDGVDVVSGYYKGLSKTLFQKCLAPYVLIMPDRLDPKNFLPATRSVAFTRSIWDKIGRFDEKLSNNEDYAFSRKLKKSGARMVFKKSAVVYWIPRKNFSEAFVMFFKFAKGDAESLSFRPKVLLIFLRYLLGILLLIYAIIMEEWSLIVLALGIVILYMIWAITKNYKYIGEAKAFLVLPLLQLVSDIAVILGTVSGLFKIWGIRKTQ
jgi:glycosyltransferase involved in cell wall biosynthesis